MCVGPAKAAEHLLLPALFFGSFFCASKRKNIKPYVLAFPVRKIIDAFAL
jgi:hypothetical protein